jgi:hypothetical protein
MTEKGNEDLFSSPEKAAARDDQTDVEGHVFMEPSDKFKSGRDEDEPEVEGHRFYKAGEPAKYGGETKKSG